MLGIAQEVRIFFASCLAGNVLYLTYQSLRIFRRIIAHKRVWISVEDLLFWIWAAFFLFLEMYRTCQGSIRWYFVLGVLIGAVISAQTVGRFLKKRIAKTKNTR